MRPVFFINILVLLMATTLIVGCSKREKSSPPPESKQQSRSGPASQESEKKDPPSGDTQTVDQPAAQPPAAQPPAAQPPAAQPPAAPTPAAPTPAAQPPASSPNPQPSTPQPGSSEARVEEKRFHGWVTAIQNKYSAEIIDTKDGKEEVWESGGEFATKDEAEKHVSPRLKQLEKELGLTKGKFLSRFSRTIPEDFKQGFIVEIVLDVTSPGESNDCLGIFSNANDAVGIIDKRISNLMKERELFDGKFFTNIQFNRDDSFPSEKLGTFSASIIRSADNPHYGGRSIEFYAYWLRGLENLVDLLEKRMGDKSEEFHLDGNPHYTFMIDTTSEYIQIYFDDGDGRYFPREYVRESEFQILSDDARTYAKRRVKNLNEEFETFKGSYRSKIKMTTKMDPSSLTPVRYAHITVLKLRESDGNYFPEKDLGEHPLEAAEGVWREWFEQAKKEISPKGN